jgi:hypothetical protein
MSSCVDSRFVILLIGSALLGACREPNAPAPAAVATPSVTPAGAAPATAALPAGTPTPVAEGAQTELKPGQLCNLEFIDGAPFTAQPSATTGRFQLRGWLGDLSGTVPGATALILASSNVGARFSLPIAFTIARPDVVQAFPGKAGLAQSGFQTDVDLSTLPPADYHLYLTYSVAGVNYACDNGRHVAYSRP